MCLFAEIPENEYSKYFAPDNSLRIPHGHIVCYFCLFIPLTTFYHANFLAMLCNSPLYVPN